MTSPDKFVDLSIDLVSLATTAEDNEQWQEVMKKLQEQQRLYQGHFSRLRREKKGNLGVPYSVFQYFRSIELMLRETMRKQG